MAAASIVVAVGSPVLGAFADQRGQLKPMIAIFSVVFIVAQALLWFAAPGAVDNFWLVIFALMLATISAEYATVLNNSLMPRLVERESLGRISGGGWALGYAGGLASLILFLLAFQFRTEDGQTYFGFDPIFPADSPGHEADRIVGPASAIWYLIFVIPFFLFTPDATPARISAGQRQSISGAFRLVAETLVNLRKYKDLAWFFVARMLFIDGLLAIFAFGGIYATILFQWQTMELGLFGIILSVAAGIGAAIGGLLDDRLGSKRVVIGALVLLIAGSAAVISIDRSHLFFIIDIEPKAETDGLFTSTGEIVYILCAILIGLSSGPLQSASRSLLSKLAPRERLSQFFGFFAFSGKVTAFAAPLAIAAISQWSGSLQIAMSCILLFLFAGLAAMLQVTTEE
jgi:UMF1 family MFS transporter